MRSARWVWCGLFLAGISASLGCEDLRPIPGGRCGNGVIDETEEDCDTFVTDSMAVCGAPDPDREDECRFICGRTLEDKSKSVCPAGYACGLDSICRIGSGKFESFGEPFVEDIRAIHVADFDGDGRHDVLTTGFEEIRVRYFNKNEQLAGMATIPAVFAEPAIGHLTPDSRADFAYRVGPGLGVIRGQSGRELAPTQYPFEPVSRATDATIIALDSLPDKLGDEVLILHRDTKSGDARIVTPLAAMVGAVSPFNLDLGKTAGVLLRSVAAADVLPDTPPPASGLRCEDLVVAARDPNVEANDTAQLIVIEPCTTKDGEKFDYNSGKEPSDPIVVVKVALPEGHEARSGPYIADLNGDAKLDLIVGASTACIIDKEPALCCAVDVAYGTALQAFSSTEAPGDAPDNRMSPVAYPDATLAGPCPAFDPQDPNAVLLLPLAIGDLNGDGIADYVDPLRIWKGSIKAGQLSYEVISLAGPWSTAAIGDFNADSVPDIIGGNRDIPGLDFVQGAVTPGGELMTPLSSFSLPTLQPPTALVAGNFDGDLVLDLALSESDPEGDDALSVAFGRPFEAPSPPIRMGRLDSILQLIPGDFSRFTYEPDNISDLAVVSARFVDAMGQEASEGEAGGNLELQESILLFPGNTDRFLQSPVRLKSAKLDMKNEVGDYPHLAAIGQFAGDPHADVAVLTHEKELDPMFTPGSVMNPDEGFGLWLLQGRMEADFALEPIGGVSPKPASDEALTQAALGSWQVGYIKMVALDLDDDALDEVLIFVPDPSRTESLLFMAKANAKARTWDITPLGPLFAADSPMATWVVVKDVRVADIDNNQKKDVAALFQDGEEMRLVIFWNNGDGISASSMTVVDDFSEPGNKDSDLKAFTFVNNDRDPELEIVLLTKERPYKMQVIPGSPPSLDKLLPIDNVLGGTIIAAGDVTGDGLDDLVIGDATGGRVWESVPEIP